MADKGKKSKLESIRKGIKSKTTSTREKEQMLLEKYGTGRIDPASFPHDFKNIKKEVGKQDAIDMSQAYSDKLPRISIKLHNARNLRKEGAYYAKITIGALQSAPFISKVSANKRTTNPDWNEDFVSRVENGPEPFKVAIKILQSKSMGRDTPMAWCEFDLFNECGMRCSGDRRHWNFPLTPQGEISVQFQAQTDLNFPNMIMSNVDGIAATVSLPLRPNPELEIIIYQAIRLQGVKRLNSHIIVEHNTFDFNALPGVKPNRVKPVLRTKEFRGNSPYWNEKGRVKLLTTEDTIDVTLVYQKGDKATVRGVDKIASIHLKELKKLSTATETRRWFAFVGTFKGGVLGIGFKAVSNMKAMEGLPEPPPILTVEEWNERQKSGGRHALPSTVKIETRSIAVEELKDNVIVQKEEEPEVEEGVLDLLNDIKALEGMEDDETEKTLFTAVDALTEIRRLDEYCNTVHDYLQRMEIEASKTQLDHERQKASREKYLLSSERSQFANEKANLLDSGLAALSGQGLKSSINNILLNLDGNGGAKTQSPNVRATPAGGAQQPRGNPGPGTGGTPRSGATPTTPGRPNPANNSTTPRSLTNSSSNNLVNSNNAYNATPTSSYNNPSNFDFVDDLDNLDAILAPAKKSPQQQPQPQRQQQIQQQQPQLQRTNTGPAGATGHTRTPSNQGIAMQNRTTPAGGMSAQNMGTAGMTQQNRSTPAGGIKGPNSPTTATKLPQQTQQQQQTTPTKPGGNSGGWTGSSGGTPASGGSRTGFNITPTAANPSGVASPRSGQQPPTSPTASNSNLQNSARGRPTNATGIPTTTATGPTTPRSASIPQQQAALAAQQQQQLQQQPRALTVEKIAQCALCKNQFAQTEMFVLKGKPFCAGCKQRLIETAQKRQQ